MRRDTKHWTQKTRQKKINDLQKEIDWLESLGSGNRENKKTKQKEKKYAIFTLVVIGIIIIVCMLVFM